MKRVLLIGSPGSGKTTILSELRKRGYTCFQEVSREIISEAQGRGIAQLFLTNPDEFNDKLLSGRITQFKACETMLLLTEVCLILLLITNILILQVPPK